MGSEMCIRDRWKTAQRFPPCWAPMPANGAALSSAGTTGRALHGASLSLVSPRESNQKEGHPDIRARRPRFATQNSLPPALLRGPSRRDVPVPSLLARRPCLASPCAAPPLGLLTGAGVRADWKFLNGSVAWVTRSLSTGLQIKPRWPGKNLLEACGGKCCAVFHPTSPARHGGRAVCKSPAVVPA